MYAKVAFASLLIGAMSFSPAVAKKSYTPAELRTMVKKGKYPKQGKAKSQSQSMSFAACKAQAQSVVRDVKPNYPAEVVVDTGILFMAKTWTNDGVVTMSCSKPDGKLVMTISEYL